MPNRLRNPTGTRHGQSMRRSEKLREKNQTRLRMTATLYKLLIPSYQSK